MNILIAEIAAITGITIIATILSKVKEILNESKKQTKIQWITAKIAIIKALYNNGELNKENYISKIEDMETKLHNI